MAKQKMSSARHRRAGNSAKRKMSSARHRRAGNSAKAGAGSAPAVIEYGALGVIAVFALMHIMSVNSDFRLEPALHRWLMTYAEGFHRRGLVGTIFTFFAGDLPRPAQIELASQVSAAATYMWFFGVLVLLGYAVVTIRIPWGGRAAILAFCAFALINPMWTTAAYDNGYTDWAAGLAVVAGLAAFVFGRPLLSGAVVAVGIVAYWGTVFVWLPLGGLIALLLGYEAVTGRAPGSPAWVGVIESFKRRQALAVWVPLTAAGLSVLLHSNDAAVAELTKIGGQENIIQETFSDVGARLADQYQRFLLSWKTYLAVALVFVLPPMVCSCLLVALLCRYGVSLFGSTGRDLAAAGVATALPLLFLVVAFDLSRIMAWTHLGFFVVAALWMTRAHADETPPPSPGATLTVAVAPLVFAAWFWTAPTIYSWSDQSLLLPCERFCFKEQTAQGRLMDAYRRRMIASPVWVYHAAGASVPGATGRPEGAFRVGREGRDAAGAVMDINVKLNGQDEGVTVRAPAQTQRAVIGAGRHQLSISYHASGTAAANAVVEFGLYHSTTKGIYRILRAPLPPSKTEYSTTITPPPELAGNMFRWNVNYSGNGVFSLREVSLRKVNQKQ